MLGGSANGAIPLANLVGNSQEVRAATTLPSGPVVLENSSSVPRKSAIKRISGCVGDVVSWHVL